MLPLSLLTAAQGQPMLVELKNGETYNGHLVNCDTWMNINLNQVICTSVDGESFWKMPEVYLRGNQIKYLRLPDEIIDAVKKDQETNRKPYPPASRGRGGRGGSSNGSRGRGGDRGDRGGRGRGDRGRGDRGRGRGESRGRGRE